MIRFQVFFQTDDNAGGGNVSDMSDEDVLNADLETLGLEDITDEPTESETEVSDSDTSEESTEEDSVSEDTDTEDEETSEETETTEEETEETEEPIEALPEATFKNIKEKYPKFFKEFPDVAKSFGKVKLYEETFATPEDAKEAYTVLGNFQEIANDLQTGNPVKLLTELADSNPEAVVEFSKNILPVLNKMSQDLFYNATLPVLSHFLKNAARAARNAEDPKYGKNLDTAVKYLSHWAFKDVNVPDFNVAQRESNRPDPEKTRLENELNEEKKARFQEAITEVNNFGKQELSKIISNNLKTIPSLKGQSPYVTNKVRADIIREVDNQIVQDTNWINSQKSLWARAGRTNYRDKALLSRIKSAYLERSKPLIPKVTKKVLLDAKLIASPKPVVKKDMSPSGRVNRHSTTNVRNINPKAVDFRSTSDLDILNGNVRTKAK